MRRFLLAAAAATLLVTLAPSPASATSYALGAIFTYSPVAGPKGQVINVNGTCYQGGPNQQSVQVNVSLAFPVRSDALEPPVDSKVVQTAPDGKFTTSLTNDIATTLQFPAEDPIDLEVVVTCAGVTARRPFASTARTTNEAPTIFTVSGPGPCGYGLAPTPEDAVIPCNAHLKGTTATGAVNTLNEYVYMADPDEAGRRLHGGTVAAGEFLDAPGPELAVGTGPGGNGIVTGSPGALIHAVDPFGGFSGGYSLAFANVFGDARDELIVGAGPGGGPHVKVFTFNEAWDQVGSFFAYSDQFRGGVSVGGADVDGDGKDEIITGAGPGGDPHVRSFRYDGTPFGPSFYAYGGNFHGGVNVAGGNLDGANGDEIVTAPGPGGGPHVRAFNFQGQPTGPGFYAYGANFAGGVNLAVGNAVPGGALEIVTAPMGGGDPHVRFFTDANGGFTTGGFYAYTRVPSGVKVALAP